MRSAPDRAKQRPQAHENWRNIMKIHGLQKMTLLDFPGHVACTVFLGGCLLDGVAITGGEPCLHRDLPEFIAKIREMGFPVKLDTNGTHPAVLAEVLERGLVEYVAMDVKNSPDKYAMTAGLQTLDIGPIRESIELLKNAGIEYEFRTTVVDELHEAGDFEEIGRWIEGARHYFLQCFTDRDTVPFEGLSAPSKEKLEACAAVVSKYVKDVQIRGVD